MLLHQPLWQFIDGWQFDQVHRLNRFVRSHPLKRGCRRRCIQVQDSNRGPTLIASSSDCHLGNVHFFFCQDVAHVTQEHTVRPNDEHPFGAQFDTMLEEGQVRIVLDTDRAMVDALNARVERDGLRNVKPEMITADDPALTAGSVDRILIVNTWHHISDRVAYAEKLRAALDPGGLLLIVDFTIQSPHGPPPQMRLTADTVRRELEAAGFETELMEESLPYQYLVAGRLP